MRGGQCAGMAKIGCVSYNYIEREVEIGCICYLCDRKVHLITNVMVVFVLFVCVFLIPIVLVKYMYTAPLIILSHSL